jgi:putative transposase
MGAAPEPRTPPLENRRCRAYHRHETVADRLCGELQPSAQEARAPVPEPVQVHPVRAKLVSDMRQLDRYPFAGHSAIMGTVERDWQDVGHVLEHFGSTGAKARREYRQFVQDGVEMGRRSELVGGGLIRSLGGWSEAKSRMADEPRMMSDERILGDGDFVESALVAAREERERRSLLRERGHDVESIAEKAASAFEVPVKELFTAGKSRERVRARSVFCYWMVSELGVPATRLARRLRLSPSAVSKAARRGEAIVRELGLRLDES